MLKFFKKLLSPFSKIKSLLGQKIRFLFSKTPDESSFESLERLFYEADLGSSMSIELVEKLRLQWRENSDPNALMSFIHKELLKAFKNHSATCYTDSPHVILIVGVNGSGKTTSLSKLASHFLSQGKTVLIAAGDTFRAAAVEQLEIWAKKLNIPLIKSQPGSDPSSVAFDAVSAAKARNIDIVLIDTAGRLQTKTDLMQELSKIRRVIQKQIPKAPQETLLVLDSTVGQNAIDQARTFHQFTPITGIILTKLDGSCKGGIAVAIQKELHIPVLWVGTGEQENDLSPFKPEDYVNALLGNPDT
jgi:fused signal recognition particle receptor